MIALRDDQITNAARLYCGRRHAWEQRLQSNVIFWSSSVVCKKQANKMERQMTILTEFAVVCKKQANKMERQMTILTEFANLHFSLK